jgi:hypothetical protein
MTFAFKPDVAVSSGKSRLDDASCQLHGIVVCVASELRGDFFIRSFILRFVLGMPRSRPILRGYEVIKLQRRPAVRSGH